MKKYECYDIPVKRYSAGQIKVIAHGFVEMANLTAVALVISQLLTQKINWVAFAVGLLIAVTLYLTAFTTLKDVN
jgi:hypothetical protein